MDPFVKDPSYQQLRMDPFMKDRQELCGHAVVSTELSVRFVSGRAVVNRKY